MEPSRLSESDQRHFWQIYEGVMILNVTIVLNYRDYRVAVSLRVHAIFMLITSTDVNMYVGLGL